MQFSQLFLELLDKFGAFVGIIIILIIALVPAIRDKWIPAMIKISQDREEFRRSIERDRLASAKRTDENIARLADAMVIMGERMTVILNNQSVIQDRENDILTALNEGITAMRERVAAREGYERGKREHKPGDTGELKASGS